MIEKHLKSGQKEQVSTEGSFIYIESSPGQVRVETHPNGFVYILPERGQVRLPDGEKFDRLSFVNESHSAGVVRIISGYGLYIPPNDGQRVNVDSVVEAIINELPNIVFDGSQPTHFSAPQFVKQSGGWSIHSMPKVEFNGAQPVTVDFPDVQAVTEAKTTVSALSSIDITGAHTIAANPDRKSLIVIADKANTDTVWLLGFIPLEAGGNAAIPDWDAIDVAGVAGDKIYIGEVL
ncbi:hypothetical protein [Vibrio crassostreae]|uniref:hypothetical protein n=1 Tax=Vibrio crassostreae TaxID=246167 RepID=UPI0010468713|nr:hypothetical protein [Vibrio crassostreae]TCT60139.1 hypothetical protein EDB31_1547 [Vibrio crassostreae]